MSLSSKLKQVVESLDLDLEERVVLTEAATGPYVVTPVLAALGGARVYAYTRATQYGTVADVVDATMSLTRALDIDEGRLSIIDSLPEDIIAKSDVITNSGHLRPLDKSVIRYAKSEAIIPLMYEAWELRAEDLDLDYIKSRGIRVVATNERHPDVDVFSYLGELAVRQIHLAGLSLTRNRFMLYCNNPFGPYLARTIGALCAELIVVDDKNDPSAYAGSSITWAGNLEQLKDQLPRTDIAGIILAAYPFDQEWIGTDGIIHPQFVCDNFPGAVVLRFAGHVDESSLTTSRDRVLPEECADRSHGVSAQRARTRSGHPTPGRKLEGGRGGPGRRQHVPRHPDLGVAMTQVPDTGDWPLRHSLRCRLCGGQQRPLPSRGHHHRERVRRVRRGR